MVEGKNTRGRPLHPVEGSEGFYKKKRWQSLERARQKQLERLERLDGLRTGKLAMDTLKSPNRRRPRAKAWDSECIDHIPVWDQYHNQYSAPLLAKAYMNKRSVMAKYGKRLPAFASLDSLVDKIAPSAISNDDISKPPQSAPVYNYGEVNYHMVATNEKRNIRLQQLQDQNRRNARKIMRPDSDGLHVWKAKPHSHTVSGDPKVFYAEVSSPVTFAKSTTGRPYGMLSPKPKPSPKLRNDLKLIAKELGFGV
jgi:hypothetical protein